MFRYQIPYQSQGIIQLVNIPTSALPHVRPAATAATGNLGNLLHDLSSMQTLFNQIRREHCHKVSLIVIDCSQDNQYTF